MSNAIDITCHEKRPSVPEELQFKVENEVLGYLEHMTARFFKRVVNTNLSSQQECFKKSWPLDNCAWFSSKREMNYCNKENIDHYNYLFGR